MLPMLSIIKNLSILFLTFLSSQISYSQIDLWKFEDQKIQIFVTSDSVTKDSIQVKFTIQNIGNEVIYLRNEAYLLLSLDGEKLKIGFGVFSGLKRFDGIIKLKELKPQEKMAILTPKYFAKDYNIIEISFDYVPEKINKRKLKNLDSIIYQKFAYKVLSVLKSC